MSLMPHCGCGVPIGVAKAPHKEDCPHYSALQDVNHQLMEKIQELFTDAKEKRGDTSVWLRKELAVSKFMARLGSFDRVIAKGEVRLPESHLPACITYNSSTGEMRVLAPSGVCDTMEEQRLHFFFSGTPYQSIAREVLLNSESTQTV